MAKGAAINRVVGAPGARVLVAVLVDLAAAAAVVGLVALLAALELPELALAVALVAAWLAALTLHCLIVRGTTPGWASAGVRLVSVTDLSPVSWSRLGRSGGLLAADTRHARDPVLPAPPTSASAPPPAAPPPAAVPRGAGSTVPPNAPPMAHPAAAPLSTAPASPVPSLATPTMLSARWAVVIDGVPAGMLLSPVVFGRQPVATAGEAAFALTDLARSISKTHLRLAPNEFGTVNVTDLGSTNGTTLRHPGGAEALLSAGSTVRVDAGVAVLFGDHRIELQQIAEDR